MRTYAKDDCYLTNEIRKVVLKKDGDEFVLDNVDNISRKHADKHSIIFRNTGSYQGFFDNFYGEVFDIVLYYYITEVSKSRVVEVTEYLYDAKCYCILEKHDSHSEYTNLCFEYEKSYKEKDGVL